VIFGAALLNGKLSAASTNSRLANTTRQDRLLIPEKLYGRAHEIDTLLGSFEHVVASGTPELVLVSGYSGIGKSSVVNELHKVLVLPRGLFASGKFDQHKRDFPYDTLARAFQNLIRPLLSKSEAELQDWRDALHEALCPNGQLIADLVPELKLIIGEQPPVPELPPQDAQGRFQVVFRRFIDDSHGRNTRLPCSSMICNGSTRQFAHPLLKVAHRLLPRTSRQRGGRMRADCTEFHSVTHRNRFAEGLFADETSAHID